MKILLVIFCVIGVTFAAPMTIRGNTIGDIKDITISATGVISSSINAEITRWLALLKNQQAVVAEGVDLPVGITPTDSKSSQAEVKEDVNLSPELTGEVQKLNISPELLSGIAKVFSP